MTKTTIGSHFLSMILEELIFSDSPSQNLKPKYNHKFSMIKINMIQIFSKVYLKA